MKRIALAAAGALALAGCQDVRQPTATDLPEARFATAGGTADVIVVLKDGFAAGDHAANQARAAEIARELGVSPTHAYGSALFGFSASVPEGRLNALRNDPRVAYVDFDAPVSIPDFVAAKPGSGGGSTAQVLPWGINRIDADVNTNEGTGIHVYILDTGIDSDHSDLQANIGNGYAVEKCRGGGSQCKYEWDDDHDHGTHVAGTVGAINNSIDVIGVASQVTLHAVKVLSGSGSGTRSGVIAGVDWVTNETKTLGVATVANMSLGGSGSKTGTCSSTGFTGTDSYHQAICNSARAGVVYAVAAGNSNADAEGAVPAAYDDAVITVSATTCSYTTSNNVETCSAGSDDWPYWSNWGDNAASWTPHGSAPVAIAAPGRYVLSTKRGGGTVSMSGTSMASPHVAGAIALFIKTNAQTASYSAFSNTRSGLMAADESTDTWTNTSGYVHNEDFLAAGTL